MEDLEVWLYPVMAALLVGMLAVGLFVRARRLRTVFISYRRGDSADETTAIAAALARRFGRSRVFHDLHSIVPGEDFRAAIARTLRRCDVAVVVVGPGWTTVTAQGESRPRLSQPGDVVCAEVAQALASGVRVLPVLVRGAQMPGTAELPPALAALPTRHALQWAGQDLRERSPQTETLCAAVAAAPMRHTPLFLVLCHAGALAVLILFAAAGGLTPSQFSTSAGIALPGLATALAALAALRWHPTLAAARSAWIHASVLAVPLAFMALVTLFVVARAFNVGGLSFEGFKIAFASVETAWGAYTGVALARMFARTGGPDEPGASALT